MISTDVKAKSKTIRNKRTGGWEWGMGWWIYLLDKIR